MTQRKSQGGGLNFFSSKKPLSKSSKDEVKNLKKPVERLRASLLLFVSHQVEFERKFPNSTLKNLDEYIKNSCYDPTSIFINCENDNHSLIMEKLVRWYMYDYKNEKLVVHAHHRITVSTRKNQHVRVKRCYPIGSFCLPPSKGAGLEEVRTRLKSICTVLGFGLEQNKPDSYCVVFSSMDVAAKLNDILTKMGWNSSIMADEFNLLIKVN